MPDGLLVEVLLDSWDRNNTITTNLLRAIPEGSMDLTADGRQPVDRAAVHAHALRAAGLRRRGCAGDSRGRARKANGPPNTIAIVSRAC